MPLSPEIQDQLERAIRTGRLQIMPDENADLERRIRRGEVNQPPKPPIDFPPYQYVPYPRWKYHAKRGVENGAAAIVIESRLVHDEDQEAHLGGDWGNSPEEAKMKMQALEAQIAEAAAVRNYDDRLMSEKAKAEVKAHEQVIDDHVLDVPAPKKRPRGRPIKIKTEMAAEG